MVASAHRLLCSIFHHHNKVIFYSHQDFSLRLELLMLLTASSLLKKNLIIISFDSNNCKLIKAHRYYSYIMTNVTYLCLKFKIYLQKVPILTNNTLRLAISFIDILAYWDINFFIFQHLYHTKLICISIHLKNFVDSIRYLNRKQI